MRSTQMFVLVLLLGLVSSLSSCQTNANPQFNYQVRVRDAASGTALTNVTVTLEIQASGLTPLIERTDSLGLARIPVVNGYVDQPGRLVVESAGYQTYTRFVDLTAGQLPENVFLQPLTTAVLPTPTDTPAVVATETAVPADTMPPPASPTAEATTTLAPTQTSTPTPTATATLVPTPTATLAGLFVVETTAYIKAYASAEAVEAQAVGALAPGTELNIIRTEPGYGGAEWYAFRLSPGLIAWVDACFTEPVRFDPGYVPRPCDVSP